VVCTTTKYFTEQCHYACVRIGVTVLWLRFIDIGDKIPESQVISKILSTLPKSFSHYHFYTTWNNFPDTGKTVKLLLSKFQEERTIAKIDQKSNNVPTRNGVFSSNNCGTYQNSKRAFNSKIDQYPITYHVVEETWLRGSRGGGHQNIIFYGSTNPRKRAGNASVEVR
jgi:predicted SprT family Zn-dependent metalloprotease